MSSRTRLFVVAALLVSGTAFAADRRDAELELSQALNAVQTAEREDSARYAPPELDEAHAMLAASQNAFDRGAWTDTAAFAERAKVSGDLAAARARQHRSESATAEIQRSVDALRARVAGGAP